VPLDHNLAIQQLATQATTQAATKPIYELDGLRNTSRSNHGSTLCMSPQTSHTSILIQHLATPKATRGATKPATKPMYDLDGLRNTCRSNHGSTLCMSPQTSHTSILIQHLATPKATRGATKPATKPMYDLDGLRNTCRSNHGSTLCMSPQTSHTSILIHHLPTPTSPLYIHIYNFPK
jgi:hypothetical protein